MNEYYIKMLNYVCGRIRVSFFSSISLHADPFIDFYIVKYIFILHNLITSNFSNKIEFFFNL